MKIYQVEQDFGDYTTLVTTDINDVLNNVNTLTDRSYINIWESGELIKTFGYKDKEPSYDNVYIELMSGV